MASADFKDFMQNIMKHGISRKDRFRVSIPLPADLITAINTARQSTSSNRFIRFVQTESKRSAYDMLESLEIRCSNVTIPGTNIENEAFKAGGHDRFIAFSESHDIFGFSFLLSKDLSEKVIFDRWREIIVNKRSKKVNFYDRYVTDVTIELLDETGRSRHTVVLEEAYPVILTQIDMDKADSGNTLYQVSFRFRILTDGDDVTVNDRGVTPTGTVPPKYPNETINNMAEFVESSIEGLDTLEGEVFDGIANTVTAVQGQLPTKEIDKLLKRAKVDVSIDKRLSSTGKLNVTDKLDKLLGR